MSSSGRAALLRELIAEENLVDELAQTIPLAPAGSGVLSAAQQRMWFMQEVVPGAANYNLSGSVRLHGEIDSEAIARALRGIVERHQILRTTYASAATDAADTVRAELSEVPQTILRVVDVSGRSAGDVAELISDAALTPFDLANDIPIRFTLLRESPRAARLVIVAHHVAMDFASYDVLLAEFAAALDGSDQPAPLPIQYADYAHWERGERTKDKVAQQLQYWNTALTPPPPPLTLPIDSPRPAVLSSAGGRRSATLAGDVAAGLRRLARDNGSTTWMALLAAVNVLLHRYSGETDIAVGAPVSLRTRPELEGLIGNFVNTVVLRTEVSGEPGFVEVIERTTRACNTAFAHQDVPFDRVVDRVAPPRSASRTPFFDVMCSYRSGTGDERNAGALTVSVPETINETARFDVVFEFTETPEALSVSVVYRTDLFTPDTVDRIISHLHNLMAAAVADPTGTPIGELPLLGEQERSLIVDDWSVGAPQEFSPTPIADIVGARARNHPDRVAIESSTQTLTYGEMDSRATALAAQLAMAGCHLEEPVGISMRRSAGQVVALLAILRAGGAFVAVDPDAPQARRDELIARAGIALIVEDSPDAPGEPVITRCAGVAPVDPHRDAAPTPPPDAVAYLIFTSGSTGEPKGVMIPHEAISFRLQWHAEMLDLGVDDAVLYKAPLSFDISVNEIFLPLVAGSRLVVADAGRDGDPAYLLDVIESSSVTFFYVVASVLDVMLTHPRFASAMAGLRHLWCGGEPLTAPLYEKFRSRSAATMYNGYGPAEATVGVTHRVYRPSEDNHGISIGRPNPNSTVYLLDSAQNPVPIGVIGEIHIGGVQLARGYLNQPLETADRFGPNPFSDDPAARLYRTGDLARFTVDGEIEFVGRSDNQVKVRGFRIELGEIEAVLGRHPDIRQAAVLALADDRGQTQLVAFIASMPEIALDAADVREWLRARVPSYLVPSDWQVRAALPLTPAGKTDRKQLARQRVLHKPTIPAQDRTPRTSTERLVRECWTAVLGHDDFGVATNFFEAGGHSLLLAAMQPKLVQRSGIDVSIVDLFAYPTVADLAGWLAARLDRGAPDDLASTTAPPVDTRTAPRSRAAQQARERTS